MPAALLPDVEAALIAGLNADSDLTALLDGRVRGDIIGPYPMLRVLRVGGPASLRLDNPLLYLDAYGDVPDKRPAGERQDLGQVARTALAALRRLTGTTVDGCTFTAFQFLTVGQWLPDPVTSQNRNHNVIRAFTCAPRN